MALRRLLAVSPLSHHAAAGPVVGRPAPACFGVPGQRRGRTKGIHPRMYERRLVLTDGSTLTIQVPVKVEQLDMYLAQDVFNTGPWTRTAVDVDLSGQLSKFAKRFSDDDFDVPGAV